MSDIQPIKPNDLAKHKAEVIPKELIKIINQLLVEKYSTGSNRIVILQKEIIDRWEEDIPWSNSYLDFECIYEASGYKVVYDKPSYGESYSANFTFTW